MTYNPIGSAEPIGVTTGEAPITISVGTSNTVILAADDTRTAVFLFNDGLQDCFLAFGQTAEDEKGFNLEKGEPLLIDKAAGLAINGITSASTTNILAITEITS